MSGENRNSERGFHNERRSYYTKKRHSNNNIMVKQVDTIKAQTKEESRAAIQGIPSGNYCLVGWDMDTTGRRLIDEICQIAAYTPSSQFAQYIMPYGDLNQSSRRRHNMRVVTVGRYRMLKHYESNKVLKTKSEISALTDFLDWLEEVKGDATDGIILIFHEPRKILPSMLIDALQRYNLLERFNLIVKGFANGYALSEAKCASTIKSFGLRLLSHVLLDKDKLLESAAERASLAYQVAQHLSQGEQQDLAVGSGDPGHIIKKNMVDVVCAFTQPISIESTELSALKKIIECQNTFRPIFGPMLRTGRRDRQYASMLRRLLAEGGVDFDILKTAYTANSKAGLEEQLVKLQFAKPEHKSDLLEILDSYFDPNRTATFPNSSAVRKTSRAEKENKKEESGNKVEVKIESGATSPDTTTSSPLKGALSSTVTSSDNTPRSVKRDEGESSGESK